MEKKKHIVYLRSQIFLFFSEALSQTIQITQQHNKSKLKNTYRIKEIIVKSTI